MAKAGVDWTVAVIVFLFAWTLTTHGKFSASGDEPHYLIIAESLRADRDLDLANNYAADDGRLFGHAGLEMGSHARRSPAGGLRSVHDIGLPFAVLPVYSVAQRLAQLPSERLLRRFKMSRGLFAYSIVAVFLIAVCALAFGLFAQAVGEWAGSRRAVVAVAAAAISPPIVSYTFLVFPETIALAVTLVVLWYALDRKPHGAVPTLVIALAVGLLPWVHRKYTFYVWGLLFLLLVRRKRALADLQTSTLAAAGLLFVLPQVALYLWTWHQWGTIAGPQLVDTLPFSGQAFARGLAGLWIDRVHGVFACGPLFLLAPACCWLERRTAWPFLVPAALLYLPMAAFVDWIGGFSTAARYIVPALPLVLVPMALALRRRFVARLFVALLVLQIPIDMVVWQHPRTLWPGRGTTNPALQSLGFLGRCYERAFPSIWTDGVTVSAIALLIVVAAGSALVVQIAGAADMRANEFSATM
jgi:hypothetical protein